MKALVIGATGATGTSLVSELLHDADFKEVHVFVRRRVDIGHPKLQCHIVDFETPWLWEKMVRGDVAFSCLGTTLKNAGSKAAQRKVDVDFQYNFAKAAKENAVSDFILVSAYNAKTTSPFFYARMKGDLEDKIRALNFEKLTVFKPGLLDRRNSKRFSENVAVNLLQGINNLGLFKSQKPLPTAVLAKAMVNAAKIKSNGYSEISLNNIFSFAEK